MRTKVVLTLLSALALVKAIDIPSTSINDIEEVQNNLDILPTGTQTKRKIS